MYGNAASAGLFSILQPHYAHPMVDRSLSPLTVSDADKPLRRGVAMAYRTALEAGRSHHEALDAAEAVYYQAAPRRWATRWRHPRASMR